jgi:hypothetical protein
MMLGRQERHADAACGGGVLYDAHTSEVLPADMQWFHRTLQEGACCSSCANLACSRVSGLQLRPSKVQ